MALTADDARAFLADIDKRYEEGRIRQVHEWQLTKIREQNYMWGANAVSDHDEDYVFDALFDVPNR